MMIVEHSKISRTGSSVSFNSIFLFLCSTTRRTQYIKLQKVLYETFTRTHHAATHQEQKNVFVHTPGLQTVATRRRHHKPWYTRTHRVLYKSFWKNWQRTCVATLHERMRERQRATSLMLMHEALMVCVLQKRARCTPAPPYNTRILRGTQKT